MLLSVALAGISAANIAVGCKLCERGVGFDRPFGRVCLLTGAVGMALVGYYWAV